MPANDDVITGLELGTGTIKVFMGQPQDDGTIAIVGSHEVVSGTRVIKGEVCNVEATADLLSEAFNAVERKSGCRIEDIYLAVTGAHIGSVNAQGSLPITSADRRITEDDVVQSTRHARAYSLPIDKTAIHSFQRTYVLDRDRRASQPVGMVASKLTADIHFIYGTYNNIHTVCNLVDEVLGSPANDIVFSGIADMYGLALPADRRRKGVLVIDIGAGITEYVVCYTDGCLHSGQIAVGCEHLANDLAIGLRLPIGKCRDLLKSHGSAVRRPDGAINTVEIVTSIAQPPRKLRCSAVEMILELRLTELFEIIKADIETHEVTGLIGDGIVLCGGGAMIPSIDSLAESCFGLPVEIGRPGAVSGAVEETTSSRFVTPIGLLHVAQQLRELDDHDNPPLGATMRRDFRRLVNLARRAIRF